MATRNAVLRKDRTGPNDHTWVVVDPETGSPVGYLEGVDYAHEHRPTAYELFAGPGFIDVVARYTRVSEARESALRALGVEARDGDA